MKTQAVYRHICCELIGVFLLKDVCCLKTGKTCGLRMSLTYRSSVVFLRLMEPPCRITVYVCIC